VAALSEAAQENIGNREEGDSRPHARDRIAVIDLGFNSLKLVCYEPDEKDTYRAYRVEDCKVRLGENFDKEGELAKPAMERTLTALGLFRDILSVETIRTVLPMVTNTVRNAANGPSFLATVKESTGIELNFLTGEGEALLSYLGAALSTGIRTGVFFDIGGGSLEIAYAENSRVRQIYSLPVGALRMTYQFARPDGTISGRNYDRLERYVTRLLPTRRALGIHEDAELVGMGGTLRAMVRFHQQLKSYPLKKIHGYRMNYRTVDIISTEILSQTVKELRKTGVFNKARAQTITAGACVVELLVRRLGFSSVVASSQGLREGALLMYTGNPAFSLKAKIDRTMVERTAVSVLEERDTAGEVKLLGSLGYLDAHEQALLSKRGELWRGVSPTIDLDGLFMQLLSSDTSLSHPDQLLMALAILRSRNERISRRLELAYEIMLPKRHEKLIERLSAFNDMLDFVKSTGAEISTGPLREGITLDLTGMERAPESLLAEISERIWEAAGIPLRCRLSHHRMTLSPMHSGRLQR
jgi:exopolyphosphatase/guanosine-5'-triphosphate,3'-diphosphate pyrophosphatase